MIIDSHSHVYLPVEKHLEIMDKEEISKTILFPTIVHPETTSNYNEYKTELNRLMQVLRGEINPVEERIKAIAELKQTVNKYPSRFIGFGGCPAGLELKQTQNWIENHIVNSGLKGIGEITLGTSQVALTENIFRATADYERLPLWFHTFNPLTSKDIKDLIALAEKYPKNIVILGHGGGSYWLETLEEITHLKNVYFDISASFTTHSVKIASELIPERVLFSIDMPYGSAQVMKTFVNDSVKDSGIRQLIFEQNIKNLLNL